MKGLLSNINDLRYGVDDTTMTEREEGIKEPLDEGKGGENESQLKN